MAVDAGCAEPFPPSRPHEPTTMVRSPSKAELRRAAEFGTKLVPQSESLPEDFPGVAKVWTDLAL